MSNHFLGGMFPPAAADRFLESFPEAYRRSGPDGDLVFLAEGDAWWTYHAGPFTLLLRGYAVKGVGGRETREEIAAWICAYYARHGDLPTRELEGSFSLVLLDAQVGRVWLYRNLAGNGFTYYTPTAGGLLFGSNLANLVDARPTPPRPNAAVLPVFFLYRFVPGRETLFADVFRLMPGELVTFDAHGLRREQRVTFADLRGGQRSVDPADQLDQTMSAVLAGHAAEHPNAGNLLSGGVDSSYIQAVWNRVRRDSGPAASYSVSVDHPQTRLDTEYALTAARALQTEHTLIPADRPYADYLIDAIASTGEPPNHVMAAYFCDFARTLAGRGVTGGMCGEGADSLFGVGAADAVRRALLVRSLLPFAPARAGAAALAGGLGRRYLAESIRLADFINDPTDVRHPVNQVALFADLPATVACFGSEAVADAAAYRRRLFDQYLVPTDPLQRLHAAGFLGEAADTASLWTTMFNAAGVDLCSPFLDSRMLRLALSLPRDVRFAPGQPKALLKRTLARHMPAQLVYRTKLGFGQPIFEWLSPGGALRPWAERIARYDFVHPSARSAALAQPNWFLVSLLSYDVWHKLFIDRSLPRPTRSVPRVAERGVLSVR